MLTNNKWCNLIPHLFVSWRASLYLMYSSRTKILIRGSALDRKIKSNWYWGFLNQSLHSQKNFPLGRSFLCVKKIKEFCRPQVRYRSVQIRSQWTTGSNPHTQGPTATCYPNRAYDLSPSNHLRPRHFTRSPPNQTSNKTVKVTTGVGKLFLQRMRQQIFSNL